MRLEHVTLGYDEPPPVLADLDWGILTGDRIGLLGPNGAGKSTLLKAIAGTLAPRPASGTPRRRSRSATSRSTRSSSCAPTESPLWHLAKADPAAREQDLRDFLGGFDFRGDMVTQPVGRFSGGEKARLTLALLVRQKPNLLLLDEPTNHLDIEMREALAEALQDYDGALVVVAHDRHLLRATTDALWLVADGAVAPFDGDLDDYRDWVLARGRRAADGPEPRGGPPTARRRSAPRPSCASAITRSASRSPTGSRSSSARWPRSAPRRPRIDDWLASPEAYADDRQGGAEASSSPGGRSRWQLARLEAEWLEISEALESARRVRLKPDPRCRRPVGPPSGGVGAGSADARARPIEEVQREAERVAAPPKVARRASAGCARASPARPDLRAARRA